MLEIRKIKSRSHRACRSLFQLFQTLSCETLDFQNLGNTQIDHALTHARRHFWIQLLEIMQLRYVISWAKANFSVLLLFTPRGCLKHKNSVLALRAVHFVFAWRPRCASHFWFLQHLSCENAYFPHAWCKCVAGVRAFHFQHAFGTDWTRVFKFEW